jgi:hypothetical protein
MEDRSRRLVRTAVVLVARAGLLLLLAALLLGPQIHL